MFWRDGAVVLSDESSFHIVGATDNNNDVIALLSVELLYYIMLFCAVGNLHLNATSSEYNREVVSLIEPFLYEYVNERHGSISAEHGIGLSKRNYIHYSRTAPALELMRRLKQTLDPHCILNPYKTVPAASTN